MLLLAGVVGLLLGSLYLSLKDYLVLPKVAKAREAEQEDDKAPMTSLKKFKLASKSASDEIS